MIIYNGKKLADEGKAVFSGSSSPIVRYVPRCIGAFINPINDATRELTVNCWWASGGLESGGVPFNKTQVEALHNALNEDLALGQTGTLIMHENTYVSVVPKSTSLPVIDKENRLTFSVVFELDSRQGFFDSQIHGDRVRNGSFNYVVQDGNEVESSFNFPILHNWESANSAEYITKKFPRQQYIPTADQVLSGGVETISVECWLAESNVKDIDSYLANYLIGPLGAQGTLNLDGNIYPLSVMTGVTNQEHIVGSCVYTLTFLSSLKC
jgi:hypothetical protein